MNSRQNQSDMIHTTFEEKGIKAIFVFVRARELQKYTARKC